MKWQRPVLVVLLLAVALLGPMVAYAGVSVIWPESTKTIDVDESPPITFAAGGDHSSANTLGFAGAFANTDNGAAYTLTVNGLSGGTITIDDLVTITKDAAISTFKIEATNTLAGISPDTLKIRLWTGVTAPTADGDAQVCAVLDLTAAGESTNSCSGTTVYMQLIYALPTGQTTESGTVTLRPSSIVFA